MNNNWGYCASDKNYKSAKQLIRKLVECVSKNGNMILNVGPNAKGEIPAEEKRLLAEIGAWMRQNGDSIYGCSRAELPKPEWGYYTQKGKKLFAHVFEPPIGPLGLAGLNGRVKKVRLLADGSELRIVQPWNTLDFSDYIFVNFGEPEHLTHPVPDDIDTVLMLELE